MNSIHSPRNKFRAEIHFSKPLKGIGSVVSITADSIEQLNCYIKTMNYKKCHVVIYENKLQYPSFNWVVVQTCDIK